MCATIPANHHHRVTTSLAHRLSHPSVDLFSYTTLTPSSLCHPYHIEGVTTIGKILSLRTNMPTVIDTATRTSRKFRTVFQCTHRRYTLPSTFLYKYIDITRVACPKSFFRFKAFSHHIHQSSYTCGSPLWLDKILY